MKFILLTHSQEILKKSNTGKISQDILGDAVEVIIWQRKNADKELLTLLSTQLAALLFPEDDSSPSKGERDTGQADRISPQVVNVLLVNSCALKPKALLAPLRNTVKVHSVGIRGLIRRHSYIYISNDLVLQNNSIIRSRSHHA